MVWAGKPFWRSCCRCSGTHANSRQAQGQSLRRSSVRLGAVCKWHDHLWHELSTARPACELHCQSMWDDGSHSVSVARIHYTHEEHETFFDVCKNFNFIIVRCNPGHWGEGQKCKRQLCQVRNRGVCKFHAPARVLQW